MVQFISVIKAILVAGKKLQQLHIGEEDKDNVQTRTVRSVLLRKLILTASSSSVISNAAKLLSNLNKDAADQRDLPNLFITCDGQFSEVFMNVSYFEKSNTIVTRTYIVFVHSCHLILHKQCIYPQVARARTTVQLTKEKLDLLIISYRKQLRNHNLEFMSVSGVTHLIEVDN